MRMESIGRIEKGTEERGLMLPGEQRIGRHEGIRAVPCNLLRRATGAMRLSRVHQVTFTCKRVRLASGSPAEPIAHLEVVAVQEGRSVEAAASRLLKGDDLDGTGAASRDKSFVGAEDGARHARSLGEA